MVNVIYVNELADTAGIFQRTIQIRASLRPIDVKFATSGSASIVYQPLTEVGFAGIVNLDRFNMLSAPAIFSC